MKFRELAAELEVEEGPELPLRYRAFATRRLRDRCLASAVRVWESYDFDRSNVVGSLTRNDARVHLERLTRQRYKQDYGFAIASIILFAVIGAVISWIVQKLLDKWWGKHHPTVQFEEGDAP